MHTLMDEFGRYATTRICMMCSSNKEESIKMIGSNIATSIEQYGNMYVKNENIDQFKEPKLMTVKVWKQNND